MINIVIDLVLIAWGLCVVGGLYIVCLGLQGKDSCN
jgi:hypothetical protein